MRDHQLQSATHADKTRYLKAKLGFLHVLDFFVCYSILLVSIHSLELLKTHHHGHQVSF